MIHSECHGAPKLLLMAQPLKHPSPSLRDGVCAHRYSSYPLLPWNTRVGHCHVIGAPQHPQLCGTQNLQQPTILTDDDVSREAQGNQS